MTGALLHGLESFFAWLLEASWQASVLVALVLLLQVTLRGRLNPRWHHALWLLVVARLLLPFLPESTLSLFQFAPSPPPVVTETVTEPIFHALPAPMTGINAPVPVQPAPYPFSVFTFLALIWVTGAVALLILTWQVNRRFSRHVGAAPLVTDPRLLKLAEAAQQELRLHRRLRIIESARVQSPAIMGLFRPTLILPNEIHVRFTDAELRFIFLHEFAHLKRGDLFLQWVVAVLQIFHWFNPVLWYAFRRMRADREPATDALVLSCTGEAHKESYGQVLVKLLEHYHTRHSLPTLVGILEDKDQFKRRFSLIARFTHGAYAWSLLGIMLIGILGVACLTKSKADTKPEDNAAKNTPIAVTLPPQEVLILAMVKDDPALAAKALQDGAPLDTEAEYIHKGLIDKNTPLCFAAEKGELDLVRLFVAHGASLKPGKGTWTNPVIVALRNGFPAVAIYLHDHGGTAAPFFLLYAAGTGDLDQITKLTVTSKPQDLDEPARMAAGCGQVAALTALLGKGANAEQAFQRAASTGNIESMQYLLGHGVDLKAAGYEALGHAAYNDKTEATAFLLKAGVSPNRQKQSTDTRFTEIDPPLNQAARVGAVGSAKLLLEASADPNSIVVTDPGYGGAGNTPLCDACDSDNDEIVRLLLDHGAGLETATSDGFTPLLYAAYTHAPRCLALLLDRGGNIKAVNTNPNWKCGVLDFAAIFTGEDSLRQGIEMPTRESLNRSMATVQVLLDHGMDASSSSREGFSLLSVAIVNGQSAWTEALLRRGANVNTVDQYGGTPLITAIRTMAQIKETRFYAVLDELLARGADPNLGIDNPAVEKSGFSSALKTAIGGFGSKEMKRKTVDILLAHGARFPVEKGGDTEKMLLAATTGDAAAVSRLLAKGVSPNVADSKGWTPLLSAAAMEDDVIFKKLVETGANVNTQDALGLNAIWFVMFRYPDLSNLHLLLDKGADLNADSRFMFYDPPLYNAITRHDPDLLTELLKHGASPNILPGDNPNRFEPLELAVDQLMEKFDDQKRRDIVTLLIAAGANRNPKGDGYRASLLFFPVANDMVPMAKFLLDAGIDPRKDADGGKGLSDELQRHGSKEMKSLLSAVLAPIPAPSASIPLPPR